MTPWTTASLTPTWSWCGSRFAETHSSLDAAFGYSFPNSLQSVYTSLMLLLLLFQKFQPDHIHLNFIPPGEIKREAAIRLTLWLNVCCSSFQRGAEVIASLSASGPGVHLIKNGHGRTDEHPHSSAQVYSVYIPTCMNRHVQLLQRRGEGQVKQYLKWTNETSN